jgi:hypothetical protein
MVTHDLDSLHTVCDRVAALADGKVAAIGPIQELLASQHPWVKSYFHGDRARVPCRRRTLRSIDGNPCAVRPDRSVCDDRDRRAFGFVYWLHNGGGLTERTVYRVHFENTVSGLLKGASVLFNGIRVGEVTNLQLDANNPKLITATIAVDAGTPVRADTTVGLDFSGLTGVPVVTLQGGSAPLNASHEGVRRTIRSDCGPFGRTEHDQYRARYAPPSAHHTG